MTGACMLLCLAKAWNAATEIMDEGAASQATDAAAAA